MRGLFRRFEKEGVRYLLIGGQAAIVHGGAYFTEDTDIWIQTSPANQEAFLRALAGVRARVYKLTPPFATRYLRRGHGYHFTIPQRGQPDGFLDVMGHPPRVGSFSKARVRAVVAETPWGMIPVVSIKDLVELKKTERPGDYEVISRLARLRLAHAKRVPRQLVGWAVRNTFRVEDLVKIVEVYAHRLPTGIEQEDPAVALLVACRLPAGTLPDARTTSRVARLLAERALDLQEAGREYWRPLVRELRELRAGGRLLQEGLPVSRLLEDS